MVAPPLTGPGNFSRFSSRPPQTNRFPFEGGLFHDFPTGLFRTRDFRFVNERCSVSLDDVHNETNASLVVFFVLINSVRQPTRKIILFPLHVRTPQPPSRESRQIKPLNHCVAARYTEWNHSAAVGLLSARNGIKHGRR